MSYGIPSDEVAEDFRQALEDLQINSRYEISNLTVIAKENTEHALAISEALKNHIKQTPPQKKLPAFYVLDSVVKNVGTPYTLFFGRQLYSTFMEAYALVDNNVRRKMDEMLKTWKEPVPGSIDTRPVFPPEVTRPIENALIKARTSAVQAHQEHLRSQQQLMNRGRPSPVPYRDTPTPPNTTRQPAPVPQGYPQQPYQPPSNGHAYGQPNGNQQYGLPSVRTHSYRVSKPMLNEMKRPPSQQYPPTQVPSWQQPQPQGYHTQETSIDSLNSDIANLILTSKADFAQNPYDSSIQTRLKALLDLQSILQSQKLPPDQIALIREQVTQLGEASRANPQPKPQRIHAPSPVPVAATPTPPPVTQAPSLESVLGPGARGALAALLARQSATPQIATPPPQPAVPAIRSPPTQMAQPAYQPIPTPIPSTSTPVPPTDTSALLQRLKAAGILGGGPTTSTPPIPPLPLPASFPAGFPSLPFMGMPQPPNGSRPAMATIPNDVELKATSLKIPRPHLIASLYEQLGAPCTQCGRRFKSDEEGRKKKTAHMDWHFRVHQRMTEAEKRGQHRSWYVDELDWIKSREGPDDQTNDMLDGGKTSGEDAFAAVKTKLQYLPVPDDPAANNVCPICQEKFEMKWLDDAQEFVWMDATKVGKTIYHASCFAEAAKDGSRGTPEPLLGKRKAEEDHVLRTKIKTESFA
ncbi:hypothetical protein BP5796_04596 [Coleophoma crateriformis]|uniref:CID domain-containing protein n=1 Tax=Coleophoma crateriformis TaxID=565419 RepID=A0A3D8S9T8_9HELO|nr:hypothetical protein BP5796_04596 [Coleophoma crateriformis]